MNHSDIIQKLEDNKLVFQSLFHGMKGDEITFRPLPEKWCMLEIVCHLYDEEREDFRSRLKHTLETPDEPLPKIDPQSWVAERKYMEKKFDDVVADFLNERNASIKWLRSLSSPPWKNIYHHPKARELSAEMFLSNWLAHDYLHFRQITFTKYHYLTANFKTRFDYAGNW